eukprot:TRINITY_DN4333_c1_g2_i1.p1 TRINITY_DN4333_c1_g2~~TRINITY_DN4333_c1_g2_i1.p1  ORF type:complete len:198 (-),score=30.79 TRINITY_DN4333_c1_g2_i1:475-1068(-)
MKSVHIYNQHDTVIGQILGDGFRVSSNVEGEINGLHSCGLGEVDAEKWDLRFELDSYDMVVTEYPFTTFTIVNVEKDLCVNITNGSQTFFPVGLVEDHENVEIRHTWTSQELGMIIFLAVMYTILMLWLLHSVAGRVMNIIRGSKEGFAVPIGSACILIQSFVLLGIKHCCGCLKQRRKKRIHMFFHTRRKRRTLGG